MNIRTADPDPFYLDKHIIRVLYFGHFPVGDFQNTRFLNNTYFHIYNSSYFPYMVVYNMPLWRFTMCRPQRRHMGEAPCVNRCVKRRALHGV
jgi:hypothetical protein